MKKILLNVDGMSCEHCVNSIKDALGKIDGVFNVDISLKDKKVEVEVDNIDISILEDEIKNLGFDIIY